jgi:hypothetical protein
MSHSEKSLLLKLAVLMIGLLALGGIAATHSKTIPGVRVSAADPLPTGRLANDEMIPLLQIDMSELQIINQFGVPAGEPTATDTGGHLWLYTTMTGGSLAIRCENSHRYDEAIGSAQTKDQLNYRVTSILYIAKDGQEKVRLGPGFPPQVSP